MDLADLSVSWRGCEPTTTVDGRCIGWRTGALFNLPERRQQLAARGVPESTITGDVACVESIGQRGLQGLASLRLHGLVLVIHRAEGMAMLATDPIGVAELWRGEVDDCQVWTSTAPQRLHGWSGVGPSSVVMLQRGRAQTSQVTFIEGPFVRHRPERWLRADAQERDALLEEALTSAVCAWVEDCGPIQASTHPALRGVGGAETGTSWPDIGLDSLAERAPWPAEWAELSPEEMAQAAARWCAERWGASWQPPEPVTRVPATREGQRWLRYGRWSVEALHPALRRAQATGQRVGLPHLNPELFALLGALPEQAVHELSRFQALGL